MLLTPHTLVGIAIGSGVPNTLVAVPISFVFHFLGDMVPHWDFYSNTTREQRISGWRPIAVMADLSIGIGIGMFFTLYALWVLHDPSLALRIFLCGIAAVAPDALTAPAIYNSPKSILVKGIYAIQKKMQIQSPLPWGIITQIIVMAISLLMISHLIG